MSYTLFDPCTLLTPNPELCTAGKDDSIKGKINPILF